MGVVGHVMELSGTIRPCGDLGGRRLKGGLDSE